VSRGVRLDRVGEDVKPRGCPQTEAREQFEATVAFWRRWLSASRYRGRWREVVHRSALTLKLLTYAPTGAQPGSARALAASVL
jgi:hypothetical protein